MPTQSRRFAPSLLRLLWRDPDPLWRWASGHYVRRWWQRPIVIPMMINLLLYAAFLVWIVIVNVADQAAGQPPGVASRLAMYGAGLSANLFFFVEFTLFVSVAGSPVEILGRLGGPSMLRSLALADIPPREIARLLYWGSWRRAALPSLTILYAFGAIVPAAFISAMGPSKFFREWVSGIKSMPWEALVAFGSFLLWLLVKPPLDCLMNLAIAWRLYAGSGRKGHARIMIFMRLLLGFPALAAVLMLAPLWLTLNHPGSKEGIVWAFDLILGVMAAAGWVTWIARDGPGATRRRETLIFVSMIVVWTLAALTGGLSDNLPYFATRCWAILWTVLGLKAVYACRCYEAFARHWPEWVEENFGEAA